MPFTCSSRPHNSAAEILPPVLEFTQHGFPLISIEKVRHILLQAVFFTCSSADNDVVNKRYFHQPSHFNKPFCHCDIFPARIDRARRMIMKTDHTARICQDGCLENICDRYLTGIYASDAHDIEIERHKTRIEIYNADIFTVHF